MNWSELQFINPDMRTIGSTLKLTSCNIIVFYLILCFWKFKFILIYKKLISRKLINELKKDIVYI